MSLDISFIDIDGEEVFDINMTHNFMSMANAIGIYECLWTPWDLGFQKAGQMIPCLQLGLHRLLTTPEEFEIHNASNGWGTVKQFIPIVTQILHACREYPYAEISTY